MHCSPSTQFTITIPFPDPPPRAEGSGAVSMSLQCDLDQLVVPNNGARSAPNNRSIQSSSSELVARCVVSGSGARGSSEVVPSPPFVLTQNPI